MGTPTTRLTNFVHDKPARDRRWIRLWVRSLVVLLVSLVVVGMTWLGNLNRKTSMPVAEIQNVESGAVVAADSEHEATSMPVAEIQNFASGPDVATDSEHQVSLRVLERVYDDGEWKKVGEIIVDADGNYRRSVFNFGSTLR